MPFTYDLQTIKTLSNDLIAGISNLLAPYVSEKTLGLLKDTITYLSQDQLLDSLFVSEIDEALQKEVIYVLNTKWAKQRFQVWEKIKLIH